MKDKHRYLIEEAKHNKACKDGFVDLKKAKTENDMIDLFYKNIDFCLAKNYPNIDFIKSFEGAEERGVLISKKEIKNNFEKLVLLGDCIIEANYEHYNVSRIYAKHNSLLIVNAKGNSFVMIDALDSAKIKVNASENANVVVNLYANAVCEGNAKVNVTGKDTYDLQV